MNKDILKENFNTLGEARKRVIEAADFLEVLDEIPRTFDDVYELAAVCVARCRQIVGTGGKIPSRILWVTDLDTDFDYNQTIKREGYAIVREWTAEITKHISYYVYGQVTIETDESGNHKPRSTVVNSGMVSNINCDFLSIYGEVKELNELSIDVAMAIEREAVNYV